MTRTKRTLWDHLKEKAKGPVEYRHNNPAKAKIGDIFTFDSVGYTDRVFGVQSIREVTREIGDETFTFTDYDLDCEVRLRYNEDVILLLQKEDEFGYDEDFHMGILLGKTPADENSHLKGVDWISDPDYDGGLCHDDDTYWRINDVYDTHKASVLTISDKNGDGTVEPEEILRSKIEYWDYWREEDSGRMYFFFAEMDAETGFITLWRGFETNKTLIQGGSN